ncbi:unnamed protein product, partial [Cuscuta epithymum]
MESESDIFYSSTKQSVIESFGGFAAPSVITVHPPEQPRNKGSRPRIKSSKEVSIQESKRPKRLRRSCVEMSHRDSWNCPLNTKDCLRSRLLVINVFSLFL